MRPPLSIVLFTVLSGAGLGSAFWLAVFAPAALAQLSLAELRTLGAGAGALVAAGLCASVGHLANPKNAWRAFMRVRSSWLSREAVAAVVFFAVGVAWLIYPASLPLRVALAALALLTVLCTAMIYQSLKPIVQWHHPLTSINYIGFAVLAGGVCLWAGAAVYGVEGADIANLKLAIAAALALVVVGKLAYYYRIAKLPLMPTGTAIGVSQAARLLDAGHTGSTFLTKEFIFHAAAGNRLRVASFVGYVLLPLGLLLLPLPWGAAVSFAVLLLLAIGVERWLFFAEARHTVRAYH